MVQCKLDGITLACVQGDKQTMNMHKSLFMCHAHECVIVSRNIYTGVGLTNACLEPQPCASFFRTRGKFGILELLFFISISDTIIMIFMGYCGLL